MILHMLTGDIDCGRGLFILLFCISIIIGQGFKWSFSTSLFPVFQLLPLKTKILLWLTYPENLVKRVLSLWNTHKSLRAKIPKNIEMITVVARYLPKMKSVVDLFVVNIPDNLVKINPWV